MAVGNLWPEESETNAWDNLRKKARKIESELDDKLIAYRKIASGPEDPEDVTDAQIKQLLQDLRQVNTQMQEWVSSGASHVLSHTLARHKDILQELTQEYARINGRAKVNREHAKLLETFSGPTNKKNDIENGLGSSEQALLREQAAISRSNGQMDSLIAHVQATLSGLTIQRSTLGDVSHKLGVMGASLPSINNILTDIRRKKSLDNIILGTVTFVCTILILLYWLSK